MLELLRPASLFAFLMAAWRLGADLGWSNAFLFQEGLLYHWQVWMALGLGMIGMWRHLASRAAK